MTSAAKPFRQEQCEARNGYQSDAKGIKTFVEWVPKYAGVLAGDVCKLTCRAKGTGYYVVFSQKVRMSPVMSCLSGKEVSGVQNLAKTQMAELRSQPLPLFPLFLLSLPQEIPCPPLSIITCRMYCCHYHFHLCFLGLSRFTNINISADKFLPRSTCSIFHVRFLLLFLNPL